MAKVRPDEELERSLEEIEKRIEELTSENYHTEAAFLGDVVEAVTSKRPRGDRQMLLAVLGLLENHGDC